MANQIIYFLNTAATTPNWFGKVQDNGTAPGGALSPFGWTVAKIALTTPYWRGRLGATARSTTAQAASWIAAQTGPVQGTGNAATTAGDSFRSDFPLTGTFAAGNWPFTFGMRTGAVSCAGRIRLRVWASANADGTSARELTSAVLVGSIVTMASLTTTYNSTVTWAAPQVVLNNEYLFTQIEWQSTTVGTSNSCTAQFYQASFTTTNWVASFTASNLVAPAPDLETPDLVQVVPSDDLDSAPLTAPAPVLDTPALTQTYVLDASDFTTAAPAFGTPRIATYDAWSFVDKSADFTLSNGDKTATLTAAVTSGVRSTQRYLNGTETKKFYVEFALTNAISGFSCQVGVREASAALNTSAGSTFQCATNSGNIVIGSSTTVGNIGGAPLLDNDIVCMAWSPATERGWFRKNGGLWNNDAAANPSTNTNGFDISALNNTDHALLFLAATSLNGASVTVRTEAADLAYPTPGGFSSWMGEQLWIDLSASALVASAPVLDTPTLTETFGGDNLTSAPFTAPAPVLEIATLNQKHVLGSIAYTTPAPVLATSTVTQSHVVASIGYTAPGPVLAAPTFNQRYVITSADYTAPAPVLATAAITAQTHVLAGGNLVTVAPIFVAPTLIIASPLTVGDWVLDRGLAALDTGADKIFICNAKPTTYLEASSTFAIGVKNFGAGLVFGVPAAGAPKGRVVTSNPVSGGTVTVSGTPQVWAVVDSASSRLLATGPATGFTPVSLSWSWTLGQIPIHMDG